MQLTYKWYNIAGKPPWRRCETNGTRKRSH